MMNKEGMAASMMLELEKTKQTDSAEKEAWPDIHKMRPRELTDFLRGLEKEELQTFLETALEEPETIALLSYWQKWFGKKIGNAIDLLVTEKRAMYDGESASNDTESLPLDLEKRFSNTELQLVTDNLVVIQLSQGCSFGCPFCGFDAVKGASEHIKYTELANLFKKYGHQINTQKPFLYWASDPSDYTDTDTKTGETFTYQDVHDLAICYANYTPHITSRKTGDEDWLGFLSTKADKPRVSVNNLPETDFQNLKDNTVGKNVDITSTRQAHLGNIGVSFKGDPNDHNLTREGYTGTGCRTGVLMTPRG